jgi:1-acyl-sn-glycerol-3-phosphate acyltransferase
MGLRRFAVLEEPRIDDAASPALGAVAAPSARPTPAAIPDNPGSSVLLWRVLGMLAGLHWAGPVGAGAQAARLRQLSRWLCQLHGIDVELRGRVPEGPVIVVANHLGYIDPLVLCSLIECSPIAKREILDWPLIGLPLARLNLSFVRRGDAASGARVLRSCLRALSHGVSVLNFPEGTTSRAGLLPFHRGAFWMARRTGLPIVPIGMDFEDLGLCWVDDEAFLPHYLKLWASRARRKVRVAVGEPLDPRSFASELELSRAARASIARERAAYSAEVTRAR